MIQKKWQKTLYSTVLIIFIFFPVSAFAQERPNTAQDIPSSADSSRIDPPKNGTIQATQPFVTTNKAVPAIKAVPKDSKNFSFQLKMVTLRGVTAFTESELSDIYQEYLQQEITLDYIWSFANQITKRYQDKGYFLSQANIPEQEIENGIVEIEITEGYIAEIDLDKDLSNRFQIKQLISRLKNNKPVNAYHLESFMLHMNTLPGLKFRAIIEPIEENQQGQVKLLLIPEEKKSQYSASLNNHGSLFLGPYQNLASYKNDFFTLQETTLSLFTSVPINELKSITLNHAIPLFPDFKLDLSGDYTNASPGDSLESYEIKSESSGFNIKLSWQPIRQRLENLTTSLELSAKNTDSNILGDTLLTKDRVRTSRLKLNYDVADRFNGYNYVLFTISQGLNILDSSEKGDSNLSRSEADPDFTTLQFNYTHQQNLTPKFMVATQLSGQIASGPVFSSEEFGYGGQAFGRAYDPSEITGDHGISSSIELRYLGFSPWKQVHFTPYTFYDIGKVLNEDSDGVNQSAASTGLGIDLNHSSGFSGEIGIAWPLTRSISNPIYGNANDPRFIFQLSYQN